MQPISFYIRPSDSGAALPFIAIMLLALFGLFAVALDLSALQIRRQQEQLIADVAALSTAERYRLGITESEAEEYGKIIAAENSLRSGSSRQTFADHYESIEFNVFGDALEGQVEIETPIAQRSYFASILGVDSLTTRVSRKSYYQQDRPGEAIHLMAIIDPSSFPLFYGAGCEEDRFEISCRANEEFSSECAPGCATRREVVHEALKSLVHQLNAEDQFTLIVGENSMMRAIYSGEIANEEFRANFGQSPEVLEIFQDTGLGSEGSLSLGLAMARRIYLSSSRFRSLGPPPSIVFFTDGASNLRVQFDEVNRPIIETVPSPPEEESGEGGSTISSPTDSLFTTYSMSDFATEYSDVLLALNNSDCGSLSNDACQQAMSVECMESTESIGSSCQNAMDECDSVLSSPDERIANHIAGELEQDFGVMLNIVGLGSESTDLPPTPITVPGTSHFDAYWHPIAGEDEDSEGDEEQSSNHTMHMMLPDYVDFAARDEAIDSFWSEANPNWTTRAFASKERRRNALTRLANDGSKVLWPETEPCMEAAPRVSQLQGRYFDMQPDIPSIQSVVTKVLNRFRSRNGLTTPNTSARLVKG